MNNYNFIKDTKAQDQTIKMKKPVGDPWKYLLQLTWLENMMKKNKKKERNKARRHNSNDEIYNCYYRTDEVASAWQIAVFSNNENIVILLSKYIPMACTPGITNSLWFKNDRLSGVNLTFITGDAQRVTNHDIILPGYNKTKSNQCSHIQTNILAARSVLWIIKISLLQHVQP